MPIVEGIEPARSPPGRGHEVSAAPAEFTPALPTPESFPFPYPRPYDIQLDLMRTVFQAIEERKIAIVGLPQHSRHPSKAEGYLC